MAFKREFIFMFFVLLYVLEQASSHTLNKGQTMRDRHDQWIARHGRVYSSSMEEERRFQIFKKNVKHIENFNTNGHRNYTLGINSFADLTSEEFRATRTGYRRQMASSSQFNSSSHFKSRATTFDYDYVNNVPSFMDWRQRGAVTRVKNQGSCSCCWAFSAVGALEGLNQINTGNLVPLSEQELLDCTRSNHGCAGDGFMENAFQFIEYNQGITAEYDYPYRGEQGDCMAISTFSVTSIYGYQEVPSNDENALMLAVSRQPVSAAIDSRQIQHYSGGLFDGPCDTNLDHAITIVGYGTDDDTGNDYWLIKNSWGESWGEDGYIRLLRGQNMCGIAMQPSYPVM